jgi:glycosyltransferase involved in cell wall biosynthesis
MRLAFCWDWENTIPQLTNWKDGLAMALKILSKEWEIRAYSIEQDMIFPAPYMPITLKPSPELLAQEILNFKPDAILFFADLTRPTIPYLAYKGIPMALCYIGGTFRDYVDCFDLFFVESEVYKNQFETEGKKVIKAFGTNTEVFKPIKQTKIWDAIFPATFARWKRHELFAGAVGNTGLAVGWMYQDHETECWQICQERGTMILSYVDAETLNYLYNASRTCVITSDKTGGSQRTVLEAMACNIPVITMIDSDKTSEYIRECGIGEVVEPSIEAIQKAIQKWRNKSVNTRDWILKNYSAEIYAQKLKEGILSICPQKSQ